MEVATYALFIFFLTALISFSVSLQVGPVSLSVMRFATQTRKDEAYRTALGGSLAELLYAALAVFSAEMLHQYIAGWEPMTYIGPIVMISFGLYLIFSADRKFLRGRRTLFDHGKPFWTGFKLGLLNPQVYLFYCGVLLAYFQFGFRPASSLLRYISFSFGAMVGFFMLLVLLIYLIRRQGKINNHHFNGSRIMYFSGGLLVIAGLIQLIVAL